ncbi:MAG TPA: ribonuclease BN, partial [Halieaceae bacterium]|nr:ribonuclease BN [Halieaceae bacterium]
RDLLVETSSEPPEYLVARDPATVTITQLLRAIRSPNEEQAVMERRVVSTAAVDELLTGIDEAVTAQLGERTLRDCVAPDA